MPNTVLINRDADPRTKMLADLLLLTEIAAQVLAAFVVVQMTTHRDLHYKVQWYVNNLRRQVREERQFANNLHYMFWQVHRTLEEAAK